MNFMLMPIHSRTIKKEKELRKSAGFLTGLKSVFASLMKSA